MDQNEMIGHDDSLDDYGSEKSAHICPSGKGKPRWKYTFESLEIRDYRLLWLAVVFWVSGGHMQSIVRNYLAYELTGSAKIMAFIGAGPIIPLLVFALFGGAVADRMDRRRILQICQVATLISSLIVAVSITAGIINWYYLLITGMIHGGVWSFISPARQALIKDIVGKEKLTNAISLMAAGLSTVSLIAPGLGGVLYNPSFLGPDGVSYLSAIVGFCSIIFIGFISKDKVISVSENSNVVQEIRSGLIYIWQDKLVLVVIGIVVTTMIFIHPVMHFLPILVKDVFDRESGSFGLLLSMLGLGSLVGSLIAASLGKWKRGLLLVVGNIVAGAAVVLIASISSWYMVVAVMVVVGLSEAGRRALSQALIMERVKDDYQGRVISVYTMSFGLLPIGIIPAGFAVDLLGISYTIAILGLGMLAVSIFVFFAYRDLSELN